MEIVPFKSIGELSFGDSRQVARKKLASILSTFEKAIGVMVDSFDDLGLHLYYDNEDRLELVEAFDPAEVVFHGISFLGRQLGEVAQEMREFGFHHAVADVGVDFPGAGIALTAPSGVIEGIAAHRRGYYDE